jgi:hypothetical protein
MLFLCSIRAPPIVVQNSLEVVFTQKIKKHNLSFENLKILLLYTHIYATFGKHDDDDDDATWRH